MGICGAHSYSKLQSKFGISLTVQQLQLTINEVKQLIKNGERVGFQKGSFVFGILKEMSFKESQFK